MHRAIVCSCLFAASLAVPATLPAQQIIHALTGTVSEVDAAAKTITVLQDSGSQGTFRALTNSKTPIALDKKIAAATTAAPAFDKQGAYAIVFYFGIEEDRTAVALKSLGAGPFSSTSGVVTKFDGHAHSITVQDDSGAALTFRIDADTVAETTLGAIVGLKLDAHKGDHVRLVSSQVNGAATAVFVRDL